MENLSPEEWREIVNKKMKFPPELKSAIQEGKVDRINRLLQTGDGIIRQLDDSEDRQWREALNLSIRLGNEDAMVALLLGVKFDFRQIHEALLVAVDTNQPRVVKRLLDRLDLEKSNKVDVRSFSQAIFDSSIDNSQFAPGVTPLTLACQKDLYEIVTMLSKKGHSIPLPHKISCDCLECRNGRQYDLLKFSLSRINTYRGIASRAHMCITSEDAMLHAFTLSKELRKLAKKEPEFKPDYLGLELVCEEFAVELLGMCRNQSEVTTILNSYGLMSDDAEESQAFEKGIPTLSRLRLAVKYNHKQFVAHPICQQVLSSIWCGNLSGWRGSRTAWKLLVSLGIFFTMPLLSLIYWIAPKSRLGKILKIPVIKFLLHAASYLWFLITLLGESITMEIYRDKFASREQTLLHSSFHMVWVVGFFWYECKEVFLEGLRSYFWDWWNCLDVMVLSMYIASFALRVLILLKGHFLCLAPLAPNITEVYEECIYFTQTGREDWFQEDPQLIAEVLFAVTSMLSFTRLAYILPAHESLGTLQISIGKMIDDMMRFMFILMIIGTAFLCGINNVYVPYVISPRLGKFNETFRFLFWTMFGIADQDTVDMPSYVVAEFVGRILYGIYTLVIVIVLLNMLIAMITNSFQKIEDDADVEWKFARSKLYLSYFREGLTMPVPFNIIPSPKAFYYLLRGIFRRICCCCKCKSEPDYPAIASMGGDYGPDEGQANFRQQVVGALVQRYIESARREFEETKRKDIGNRITELSKVVGRLHGDIKLLKHALVDEGHNIARQGSTKEGSSILGKYIMGAKNNFRGFKQDGHVPLQHHTEDKLAHDKHVDEETEVLDEKKEQVDAEERGNADVGRDREVGSEQVTDADVVRMEEGRVTVKVEEQKEMEESNEPAEKPKNRDGIVNEERTEKGTVTDVEERVDKSQGEKLEVGATASDKGPAEQGSASEANAAGGGASDKKVNIADVTEVEKGLKDVELKDKKVEGKGKAGRKEDSVAQKAGVKESTGTPVNTKVVPSPTGSSSSKDTGFGSQEGEGSIDGALGSP